jgi:hypothetical protein
MRDGVTSCRTVQLILVDAIRAASGDGLLNADGECACLLDDLAPCDCLSVECEIGYRRTCSCGEWFMVSDPSMVADQCENCREQEW